MVDDLNVLFAHQTIHRFNFNPSLFVSFTSYDGPPEGYPNELAMLNRGYDIEVKYNPTPGHPSMSFRPDGATYVDSTYGPTILDRDVPMPTANDADGWNAYWLSLGTLAHEILHGVGGGAPEYYKAFAFDNESTGVAPNLARGTVLGDAWELEREDYATDPLGKTERSAATIADRLLRTRFSQLTVAHANGRLRANIGADPRFQPDLAQTRVHVTGPDGETPAVGAMVYVGQPYLQSYQSLYPLVFSGVTAADGSVSFNWTPTWPMLLVKV